MLIIKVKEIGFIEYQSNWLGKNQQKIKYILPAKKYKYKKSTKI